ncbi:MAG: hypothetical protein ACQKBU_11890, partial [Verrucomicrobiales bacterium]
KLLYSTEYHTPLTAPLQVIVHREGWDPIRLTDGTNEWASFPLTKNDRIAIEAHPKDHNAQLIERKSHIRLAVPDTHFTRIYPTDPSKLPHDRGSMLLPTLSELITNTYAASPPFEPNKLSDFSQDPKKRLGELADTFVNHSVIPTVLPHPDLASIRIRRLEDDGSETIIHPPLAENIANFAAQTTAVPPSEPDTQLQPGDIVELPLRQSSEPWTGFSEEESRYFHHLLSGAFQVTDDNGKISRREINWQPAVMLKSPCGPIPLQPEHGTASTTAHALGVHLSKLDLFRDNQKLERINLENLFLRDGDQLSPCLPPVPRPPRTNELIPRVRRIPVPSTH